MSPTGFHALSTMIRAESHHRAAADELRLRLQFGIESYAPVTASRVEVLPEWMGRADLARELAMARCGE